MMNQLRDNCINNLYLKPPGSTNFYNANIFEIDFILNPFISFFMNLGN